MLLILQILLKIRFGKRLFRHKTSNFIEIKLFQLLVYSTITFKWILITNSSPKKVLIIHHLPRWDIAAIYIVFRLLEKNPFVLRALFLIIRPDFVEKSVVQDELRSSTTILVSHGTTNTPVENIMDKITDVFFKLGEVFRRVSQSTMDGYNSRRYP